MESEIRIEVENLGVLKQASLELNHLTIICGENNTGKTYAAYSLFGFLHLWRRYLFTQNQKHLRDEIETLLQNGNVNIDLKPFHQKADQILKSACDAYAKDLPEIFAAKSNLFQNSRFRAQFDQSEISIDRKFYREFVTSNEDKVFSAEKHKHSDELVISLLVDRDKADHFPKHVIGRFVSSCIGELLLKPLLPNPFIASVERTGATIFKKELNFARNRLLEEMMKSGGNMDPMDLLFKSYKDYPLPVKVGVDFARNSHSVENEKSYIAEEYPDILSEFSGLLGGEYEVGNDDAIVFRPIRNSVKLNMDESSSSVRSLLDLGFYLRHKAKKGDLLLIDEPELNLHPQNQCRIARLFTRLVHAGIKVLITTHSDYIVKELNTLIMLNNEAEYLKDIAIKYGCRPDELLDSKRVSACIAETGLVKLKGNSRRSRCSTLVAMEIDKDYGIDARSFDVVIDRMNEIQQEIIWGGE